MQSMYKRWHFMKTCQTYTSASARYGGVGASVKMRLSTSKRHKCLKSWPQALEKVLPGAIFKRRIQKYSSKRFSYRNPISDSNCDGISERWHLIFNTAHKVHARLDIFTPFLDTLPQKLQKQNSSDQRTYLLHFCAVNRLSQILYVLIFRSQNSDATKFSVN